MTYRSFSYFVLGFWIWVFRRVRSYVMVVLDFYSKPGVYSVKSEAVMKKTKTKTTKVKAPIRKSIPRTKEENIQIRTVIDIVCEVFSTPQGRRPYDFGNPYLRTATDGRIKQTGFEETKRLLGIYVQGVKLSDPYRPTFNTPLGLLTGGWLKVVAFADRNSKIDGKMRITNTDLRDKIADQLANGGATTK